jgi:hypothetical protein
MDCAWGWGWCGKLWHTSYASYESKIVIHINVASGGAHHLTWEFHIMWHSKQESVQYLEYHIKHLFGVVAKIVCLTIAIVYVGSY